MNNNDWLSKLLHLFLYNPKEPLLFNTGLFLFLFLVLLFFYQFVYMKKKSRVLYLTLFSLFFYYKSGGMFFLLLISSTIVDYNLAKWIYHLKSKSRKTALLVFSLVINLGLLAYFKYTNFFFEILSDLQVGHFNPVHIILPVGISFYTFQVLSYTIDVYRGLLKPSESILDFGFYICFFPHLVAGPIVRAVNFLPQINQDIKITKEDFGQALFLIITGLFKKAVISDYISVNFVDRVFDSPTLYTGLENLMAVYGYAMQIYCDFSGYSDMAIGVALLMGYRLGVNFDLPYQSASITEFWRRWHISLSSWLRDYLYIPLGGNRRSGITGYAIVGVFFSGVFFTSFVLMKAGNYWMLAITLVAAAIIISSALLGTDRKKAVDTNVNLMSTMLLGGLWHGASWNFIFWGFMHGAALSGDKLVHDIVKPPKTRLFRILGVLFTFHFVCFCWIFFRASTFPIAWQVISQVFSNFNGAVFLQWVMGYKLVFFLIAVGFITHFFPASIQNYSEKIVTNLPLIAQSLIVIAVIWMVIQVKSAEIQPFIYFQF